MGFLFRFQFWTQSIHSYQSPRYVEYPIHYILQEVIAAWGREWDSSDSHLNWVSLQFWQRWQRDRRKERVKAFAKVTQIIDRWLRSRALSSYGIEMGEPTGKSKTQINPCEEENQPQHSCWGAGSLWDTHTASVPVITSPAQSSLSCGHARWIA